MRAPHVIHGTFTIERRFEAPVARAFAAWTDIEIKAQWFIGPPDVWTLKERALDFRVGGRELLRGELASGITTAFSARYHAIVPNERLVYAYDMHRGEQHLSVSLATVELRATAGGGTHMTFTEQAAFLDGEDGTKSRQAGTAAHFDRLPAVLGDPHTIVSSRVLDAPRERVLQAFRDPERLARWWGPAGFSNSFEAFELRAGGLWRFTMQGPDGARYPLVKEFLEVSDDRIALRQLDAVHGFTMAMTFTELDAQTLLTWRMRFDSSEEAARIRAHIERANEENFDRLAASLAG